jgi:hypothetical protein
MGICPSELQHLVIRPTLEYLGEYSLAAQTLLMATAAMESELGFHLKNDHNKGLGVYQISPRSHHNLWDQYLAKDPDMASKVRGLASQHEFLMSPHHELVTNLRYATAIAWMMYKRKGKTLPAEDDIQGIAKFWRRHFHRRPQASVDTFIDRYNKLINQSNLAA